MISKQILPESYDFGVPSVELVGVGRKGLDKTAMVKRASAFDDILEDLKPKDNRTYLHVITTGASEFFNANLNGDAYPETSHDVVFISPEDPKRTHEVTDGGLLKYHDDEYMKNGAVYQEHKTKKNGVQPSGEIISARYNKPMHRGELIIAVDTDKWAPRLERKAKGQDIYLSIGCEVARDLCPVCGRSAKTMKEHCDHFNKMRGQILDSGIKCHVINDAPKFYDISGVDIPADRIAFVLNKVASGASVKEASVQALMQLGNRRPMLFTKSAAILDKLSKMEKKIMAMVDDGNAEAYMNDLKAEEDFVPLVQNWPADEVIDGCSRKGILLSPGMLFKIMGKEGEVPESRIILCSCDDGCCGDCSEIMTELDEDEDKSDVLMDGSFDAKFPMDLNLDRILEQFMPEFGCSDPAINTKIIKITITGRSPSSQHKEAKFNKQASQALRNVYARYLISFAERNNDSTCWNAMRKCAHWGR